MGQMNLLKANWYGKVGQTIGAKWKNKSTIRSFTKPANPNTPAQQTTRTGFKELTSFVALFAAQLKSLSALNTKAMSVRNAILSINHQMIAAGAIDAPNLIISKGGLPKPIGGTATAAAGLNSITVTWTPQTAANISTKCKLVAVVASTTATEAFVGSALQSAGTLVLQGAVAPSTQYQVYTYLLDYRGSSKVGSLNTTTNFTSPAS